MTDDRNDASNGGGTNANEPAPQASGPVTPPPDIVPSAVQSAPPPGSPAGERPGNPPPAAPPPASGAPSPPPLAAGPQPPAAARPVPWAAIIAVVLGVILIVLVILWFTGVLDRSPRKATEEATAGNGTGPGLLGPLGGGGAGRPAEARPLETPPPAAPQPGYASGYPPTVGSLQGTWGPGCPESRADVITLYSSGRAVVAPRGEGTWSLNGYDMTLTINGSPLTFRWEHISQDEARVTQAGTDDVETVRRCD